MSTPLLRWAHSGAHGEHSSTEPHVKHAYVRQCQRVTIVGGITNVFFSLTKLLCGSVGGSVALVADGFHALTDIFTDIISYTSLTLSRKKLPRCDFPFGMGRLEAAGAVVVAAVLFFGGVGLLIQSVRHCVRDLLQYRASSQDAQRAVHLTTDSAVSSSIVGHSTSVANDRYRHHQHDEHHSHAHASSLAIITPEEESSRSSHDSHSGHSHAFPILRYDPVRDREVVMWSMLLLAASSVVCKEVLFHWTRRVGMRARSRVTVANAFHHRADAWSGAVALVGVSAQYMGIPGVDGLAGVVVSLSICKMGYGVFRDAVLEFFDYQDAAEVAQVRAQLQKFHLHRGASSEDVRWCSVTHGVLASSRGAAATSMGNVHASTQVVDGGKWGQVTTPDVSAAAAAATDTIRFINVLLTRHGNDYTLHVTLLVPEVLCAREIAAAVDKITELAQSCMEVKYTYTVLIACSEHTLTREAYRRGEDVARRGLPSDAVTAAVAEETHESAEMSQEGHHPRHGSTRACGEHAESDELGSMEDFDKLCAQHGHSHSHGHGHSHRHAHGAARSGVEEHPIAAHGDVVNPSLERCLRAVMRDHSFVDPIRYTWEQRAITAPATETRECRVDVQAIADMFGCQLHFVDAKENK